MRLVRQQPFVTSTLELAIQQNVKHPTRRDSDHFFGFKSTVRQGAAARIRPLPAPFVLRSELFDDPIHHHSQ